MNSVDKAGKRVGRRATAQCTGASVFLNDGRYNRGPATKGLVFCARWERPKGSKEGTSGLGLCPRWITIGSRLTTSVGKYIWGSSRGNDRRNEDSGRGAGQERRNPERPLGVAATNG